MAVAVVCPACRDLRAESMQIHTLDDQGRCSHCLVQWPTVGAMPLMLADAQAATRTAGHVEQVLSQLGALPVGGYADADEQNILEQLVIWLPAHWGAYAEPPLPWSPPTHLRGWLDCALPPGPILVLGCAAGGEIPWLDLEDRQVVAMDANVALVQAARKLARGTLDRLPSHSDGLRYEVRPVELPSKQRDMLQRVQWLVGDALDPPFLAEQFAAVVALNLFDSVSEPLVLLGQCEALLQPGGVLLLSSPYHFQASVTPNAAKLLQWLPPELPLPQAFERLFTGEAIPGFFTEFRIEKRAYNVPWRLPVHPGFIAEYRLHALRLRKK